MKPKTITVIGANSQMGMQSAAIIAAFGSATVHMVCRTKEKAADAIARAAASVRSEAILDQLKPATYDDLNNCVATSDWILEAVAEDESLKKEIFSKIGTSIKSGALVTTTTSGISIEELSQSLPKEHQENFFGTHFFNPPYKMLLCELIAHPGANQKTFEALKEYLESVLLRKVIVTNDVAAFAANRIGFEFMNEVMRSIVENKTISIERTEALFGGLFGHTMPPASTLDFVGLDVNKAIMDNLNDKEPKSSFQLPEFVNDLIKEGNLGRKSGSGLTSFDKESRTLSYFDPIKNQYQPAEKYTSSLLKHLQSLIKSGKYQDAIGLIITSDDEDAKLIQEFMCKYLSMCFEAVGPVVGTIEDVDIAMGYGFAWLPPTALIELLGGVSKVQELMKAHNIDIPKSLASYNGSYSLTNELDYRQFLRAK